MFIPVLQPWLCKAPLKCQSILLSGIRSPDIKSPNVKKCVRWLRGISLLNGDPNKQDFMETVVMSDELIMAAMEELQYLPVHFVHHFADSFAIVTYFHEDKIIADYSWKIHNLCARELFHFHSESMEEFLERHKDKVDSKTEERYTKFFINLGESVWSKLVKGNKDKGKVVYGDTIQSSRRSY